MIHTVVQGHDVQIDLSLKNAAGSPLKPSDTSGILLLLYYKVSGQVLAKFSRNTLQGYLSIEVINDTEGKIRATVPASVMRSAQLGDVLYEIKVKTPAAGEENNDIEQGKSDQYAFTITNSRLKNVTTY